MTYKMARYTSRKRKLVILALILVLAKRLRRKRCRTTWTHEWLMRRQSLGAYNNVIREIAIEDSGLYQRYFRMDPETFHNILAIVGHRIGKLNTRMRKCISPGERLSVTMRFLATGETFRSLSLLYRIGERTISQIVFETCTAIYEEMTDKYLKTPRNATEWKKVASGFETKWNYPFCIGALDGKHIAIRPPPNTGSTFFNYKHFFSIILLALVDADYKFLYVDVGANGRCGDAGVFQSSTLKNALTTDQLNLPQSEVLQGTQYNCSYHIIGDDAFPLQNTIMKPFPHRDLEKDKRIFNYRLSRARRVVENAFGILANRFRVFLTTIDQSPAKVEIIVLACCCLHNYLIERSPITGNSYAPVSMVDHEDENHDNIPGSWRTSQTLNSLQPNHARNAPHSAKNQREMLRNYFVSDVGAVPWQDKMTE